MVSRAIINGWPLVPPSKVLAAPTFSVEPSISGVFTVGSTLTGSVGTIDGFPVPTSSVRWLRDGNPISGATGTTYTLTDADLSTRVDFAVSASNVGGTTKATAIGSTVIKGAGGGPVTPVVLDAPFSTALKPKLIVSYGLARWVDGFAANSVTAKNLDTSATLQNGFNAQGIENVDALPANAAFVSAPDQNGGAVLLQAVAGTNPIMKAAGIAPRLACDSDPVTGQLTRSTIEGGSGINLGGNSALYTGNLPIVLSTGDQYEFHIAWSNNNRKKAQNDTTDLVPGGDSVQEHLFCYGADSNNVLRSYLAGGNFSDRLQLNVGGTSGANTAGASNKSSQNTYRFKKNGQNITTYIVSSSRIVEIENGAKTKDFAPTATQLALIQSGSLDNKSCALGAIFAGAGSSTLATTNRGNIVIFGFAITKGATISEIVDQIHPCASRVGQSHLLATAEELLADVADIIDWETTNPATGRVVGRKGNLTIDANTGGTFSFNALDPDTGARGLRSPDNSALNSYQATDSYFVNKREFTILRFGMLESGSLNNNVQIDLSISKGSPQSDTSSNATLMMGWHHAVPAFRTAPSKAFDLLPRIGARRKADLTLLNYDGSMQTQLKYNTFTAHIKRLLGDVYNGIGYTKEFLENLDLSATFTGEISGTVLTVSAIASGAITLGLEIVGPGVTAGTTVTSLGTGSGGIGTYNISASQTVASVAMTAKPSFKLDAPLPEQSSDAQTYPYKLGQRMLQINVHVKSTVYDATNPDQTLFFTAENRSYISGGGVQPLGHMDGSIAVMPYAAVFHSDGSERIQSVPYQSSMKGYREKWILFDNAKTSFRTLQKLQVNFDKLKKVA